MPIVHEEKRSKYGKIKLDRKLPEDMLPSATYSWNENAVKKFITGFGCYYADNSVPNATRAIEILESGRVFYPLNNGVAVSMLASMSCKKPTVNIYMKVIDPLDMERKRTIVKRM